MCLKVFGNHYKKDLTIAHVKVIYELMIKLKVVLKNDV